MTSFIRTSEIELIRTQNLQCGDVYYDKYEQRLCFIVGICKNIMHFDVNYNIVLLKTSKTQVCVTHSKLRYNDCVLIDCTKINT
jgi:hypothetical protein